MSDEMITESGDASRSVLHRLTQNRTLPDGHDGWALKSVDFAGRTRGGFAWPASGPVLAPGPLLHENTGTIPCWPGDGICAAFTYHGMASGGYRALSLLLVAFRNEDVLGITSSKVRLSAATVVERLDGEQVLCELGYSADLQHANLQHAILQYANLGSANLQSADLRFANLQHAILQYANLQRAYLQRAYLQRADLQSAHLRRANLQYADLQFAELGHADLQSAYLRHADLRHAKLQHADLQYADLRHADLRHADLRHADLRRANLWDANLWYANLQSANLRGASLRYANLRGADLQGADFDHHTRWPEGFDLDRLKGR